MNSSVLKTFLVGATAFLAVLFATKLTKAAQDTGKYPTVTLSKKNTVTFRDVVTGQSVGDAQAKVLALSNNLAKDEPIYLYLDTPGGSIVAGEQLIHTLHGIPHEVKTVTSFAASMGFITAQSLGERLILPNGILMSHRAKVGIEGQLPGEFNTEAQFWTNVVSNIEGQMARRMEMTLKDYQSMIRDEYWVSGDKAVADHAADRVVNVRCGEDMQGTYVENINTVFGPIAVTWSECPLISSPLNIAFSGLDGSSTDSLEIDRVKRTTFETLNNRLDFVKDPVLQQSYYHYVK